MLFGTAVEVGVLEVVVCNACGFERNELKDAPLTNADLCLGDCKFVILRRM